METILSQIRTIDFRKSLQAYYPPAIRMFGAGLQFLNTVLIARALGGEGSSGFFFWSSLIMSAALMSTYGTEQLALRDVPRLNTKGISAVKGYLAVVRILSLSLAGLIGIGITIYAMVSDGFALWQLLIPIGLAAMTTVIIDGEVLKGLSRPCFGMIFGHFIPVCLFFIYILMFVMGTSISPESPSAKDGGASVWLLVMWIGSFVMGTLFVRYSGHREFRHLPVQSFDRETFKTMLKEGRSVCGGAIFGALTFIIPLAILKEKRPPEEVSYVTTAFRISVLFNVLSGAIFSVFAPKISKAAESLAGKALFREYGKAIAFSTVALGPPLLIGIFFPGFIMSIFGGSFEGGANSLRLLLASNLITLLLGPVLLLMIMIGCNRHLPKFGVGKLAIASVLAWFLVPEHGGDGMVLALILGILLEAVFILLYIVRKVRYTETS